MATYVLINTQCWKFSQEVDVATTTKYSDDCKIVRLSSLSVQWWCLCEVCSRVKTTMYEREAQAGGKEVTQDIVKV